MKTTMETHVFPVSDHLKAKMSVVERTMLDRLVLRHVQLDVKIRSIAGSNVTNLPLQTIAGLCNEMISIEVAAKALVKTASQRADKPKDANAFALSYN